MQDESKAFKNLINDSVVLTMGQEILRVYPEFSSQQFMKLTKGLAARELKARVLLITSELKIYLPESYPEALKILVKIMEAGNLKGFALWPFSEYIGQFGLDHFDESMKAMHVLTQKFTAEWAIRPFFLKDPGKVLKYFKKWSTDKNVHVRRWVSEGSRPLLPWGTRLPIFIMDPTQTLLLLDKLKFDEELYVRKSVANHLNDISKNHPAAVIQILKLWESDCPAEHIEKLTWIKRQALRTLIKKGEKNALALMGVVGEAQVKVMGLKLQRQKFKRGDKLEVEVKLASKSKKDQKLVVDYLIDFMKANGKKSKKVFKWKTFVLKGTEVITLKKSHDLKTITTMTYYKGEHHLYLQVNGQILGQLDWHLIN